MMNGLPLVTIGITCFNAQDTIVRSIKSALDQDYPNTEIIIVNDCSTDNSANIVCDFIKKIPKARLINHNVNGGVANALNSVVKNASGEFIAIFDDDDISLPSRISIQIKAIQDYEAKTGEFYVACWGSGYKLYSNGYKAHFSAIGSRPRIPVGKDLIRCQLYMGRDSEVFFGNGTPGCSLMVRRRIYDEVGLYDPVMRRTEDTDFALRLAMKGGHFIGVTEEVVIQTSSIGTDKRPEVGYKSELSLIEKYKSLFDCPRRYEYAKDWVALRFHHFGKDRLGTFLAFFRLLIKYPSWTLEQFFRSAPKRLIHEWKMSKKKPA